MQPILQTISIFFVCVCAFEDVMYVYGQDQEMVEHGRIQYQVKSIKLNSIYVYIDILFVF